MWSVSGSSISDVDVSEVRCCQAKKQNKRQTKAQRADADRVESNDLSFYYVGAAGPGALHPNNRCRTSSGTFKDMGKHRSTTPACQKETFCKRYMKNPTGLDDFIYFL